MRSLDVPQANDLDKVRAVVQAVHRGATTIYPVADFVGCSKRHASYRLHAARILGWVHADGDAYSPTTAGERLVDTPRLGPAERAAFSDAIKGAPVIQIVAPDLLGRRAPALEELADRLLSQCDLSRSTALRRAGGLLTWRRRVLGPEPPQSDAPPANDGEQLDLFG